MSIRVAIVGPTGYTGLHLIERLLRHPGAKLTYLASARKELPDIAEVFPRLAGRLTASVSVCRPIDVQAIAREADVVFLGLPHKVAMTYAGPLLDAGLRVIDLSADYRLRDADLYEQVYNNPHIDTEHLGQAVYGLPELYRESIAKASLIANPGCYPTAATLAISPLLAKGLVQADNIIVNAASGTTGAGRSPKLITHFPEHNESYSAYGQIGGHRHQPELEQTLDQVAGEETSVLFVPHLLPIDQGILETIYLQPTANDITEEELFETLERAYENEPFVRVRNDLPNVKYVCNTNFCDLSVRLVESGPVTHIVVFTAIDNMIKGASGQAIQNMNIMFGQDETAGLL